ncbi:hypothetical protein ALP75_200320 [Pseudomonas syringae pv. actinidiae]|nr:hypothetical protein ALP75_200320 [Pseudomonas syringae pv. actinidiae]
MDAFALVQRVGQRLSGILSILDLLVEARQVTHAHLRHQLVAAFHLGDAPAQGVGSVLHVGHHRTQQVWNTFVDGQFEHFRVDHDQLGIFRAGLEQDRQDHCVHTHRLTGTGGTGHQQVGHFRQIGNHRLAADVVAQRQGDRRLGVIVFGGRQHLGEPHDLAVFVGDFDTHGGLARNHLDHTHAGHGERTCKVLGQVGDATDLYASGGLNFVTGDDRARMNRIHRDLDAELLELDFQQMTDRCQRLRRIVELLLFRRIKDRDRRQGAFDGAVNEQRGLFFLQDALAWLGRLRRCWGDDRRHVFFALGHVLAQRHFAFDDALSGLGLLATVRGDRRHDIVHAHIDLAQLRNHLFTLGTGSPPAICSALKQLEQVQGDLAGDVHHLEPRQIGKHCQAEQEQCNEQQGTALDVQRPLGQIAQYFAQHAARRARKTRREVEMNMCQRSTCQYQEDQPDQAPRE